MYSFTYRKKWSWLVFFFKQITCLVKGKKKKTKIQKIRTQAYLQNKQEERLTLLLDE